MLRSSLYNFSPKLFEMDIYMDINSMRFINYSFNGICSDVYDPLDYETHATNKTMRSL